MEAAFAATSTFTRALPKQGATVCRSNAPRMSVSRREALAGAAGAAAATLLSGVGAALAKGGDSPKISFFGVGGASSPYSAGVETGGTVQYKELSQYELDYFKSVVSEADVRLASTIEPIRGKSWADVQSRIRLEMNLVRNIILKVNAGIEDEATAKKATAIYQKFKLSMEDLDYAATVKNQSKALSSYNAVVDSYKSWRTLTGI